MGSRGENHGTKRLFVARCLVAKKFDPRPGYTGRRRLVRRVDQTLCPGSVGVEALGLFVWAIGSTGVGTFVVVEMKRNAGSRSSVRRCQRLPSYRYPRRRINCPPACRATRNAKSAVRIPPTCRYPVGLGAKRVRIVIVLFYRLYPIIQNSLLEAVGDFDGICQSAKAHRQRS